MEPLLQIFNRSDELKEAIFQEPFGFAKPGTIEQAFESVFGIGSFAKWLEALEENNLNTCFSITE